MFYLNVGADQISQWWDGCVCKKSKALLKLPLEARQYLVVLALEGYEILHRSSDNTKNGEVWDLAPSAPRKWRVERLRTPSKFVASIPKVDDGDLDWYAKVLGQCLSRVKFRQCGLAVGAILNLVSNGSVRPIGWDARGRLALLVTRRGSRVLNMPEGAEFFSAIGLLETERGDLD